MSVTQCLGPAIKALGGMHRSQWRPYIESLPQACPHGNCTAQQGCRAYVADYFRVQWQLQQRLELKAGAAHG